MGKDSKNSELFELYCNYYDSFLTEKSCKVVQDALTHMEKMISAYSKDQYKDLVGYLYAASSYSLIEKYISSENSALYDKILSIYLSYLKLTVEIDDKGNHRVNASEDNDKLATVCQDIDYCLDYAEGEEGSDGSDRCDEAPRFSITRKDPEETKPIEVKEGSTVIQIQNLNIYFTADVVQQLNMNPQQVINNNTEFIRDAAIKAVKDVLKNGLGSGDDGLPVKL